MTHYVRAPGTCGGISTRVSINGQSFLVTCPINRYSYALSNVKHPFSHHFVHYNLKSALARQLVQRLLEIKNKDQTCPPVYVRSDIIQGKGITSSSTDISVTAMATALAVDYDLSLKGARNKSVYP